MSETRVPRSFRAGRGELHRQLSATLAALGRNRRRATVNKQKARRDMRTWQVKRRRGILSNSGVSSSKPVCGPDRRQPRYDLRRAAMERRQAQEPSRGRSQRDLF